MSDNSDLNKLNDANWARVNRRKGVLEPVKFLRTIKIPLLEIEETVIKSTPEDVEWSFALREFNSFSEEIQDAIWALLKRPDTSILRALHSLMAKAITKKIMNSGVKAVANLDLVEAKDVVVVDKECQSLVSKVGMLLHEMRDSKFVPREFEYLARGEEKPIVLKNRTWMTQSLVESMILSLQHSYLRANMNMDETMIGNLLKEGSKLKPAIYDFFVEQVNVIFDERLLLVPIYKNNNAAFTTALGVVVGNMTRTGVAEDNTGVPPRIINFLHFREFMKDCELVDENFPSLFFCYLYPKEAETIFNAFIEHMADEDYLLYGAPSLETWVESAVASKTVNGLDFRFSESDNEVEEMEAHVVAMDELDIAIAPSPGSSENPGVEDYKVDYESYLSDIVAVAEKTVDDYCNEVGGEKIVGLTRNMTLDLARSHERFAKIVARGEFLRLVRINGHDASTDADTNKLADMFPDQYQVFYQDMLTDGLVIPDSGIDYTAVTNESYMGHYLSLRYPKEKILVNECNTSLAALSMYEKEGPDILMLDLNQSYYDSEKRKTGRFSKIWTSPILASTTELYATLKRIYLLMGGDDYANNDDRLTAWIRVPVLCDFRSFLILFKIMTSMVHRVSVTYPKGMHESFFDLKIYPVEYKQSTVTSHLMVVLARTAATQLYATRFFDHFAVHLHTGIQNRHKAWEFASVGVNFKWKSHRYKMLANLDFRIEIDVERVKHMKQIVTHDAGRRVKRENARKRAKALKDDVRALHRKLDSNMSKLRMGIKPKGMVPVEK